MRAVIALLVTVLSFAPGVAGAQERLVLEDVPDLALWAALAERGGRVAVGAGTAQGGPRGWAGAAALVRGRRGWLLAGTEVGSAGHGRHQLRAGAASSWLEGRLELALDHGPAGDGPIFLRGELAPGAGFSDARLAASVALSRPTGENRLTVPVTLRVRRARSTGTLTTYELSTGVGVRFGGLEQLPGGWVEMLGLSLSSTEVESPPDDYHAAPRSAEPLWGVDVRMLNYERLIFRTTEGMLFSANLAIVVSVLEDPTPGSEAAVLGGLTYGMTIGNGDFAAGMVMASRGGRRPDGTPAEELRLELDLRNRWRGVGGGALRTAVVCLLPSNDDTCDEDATFHAALQLEGWADVPAGGQLGGSLLTGGGRGTEIGLFLRFER